MDKAKQVLHIGLSLTGEALTWIALVVISIIFATLLWGVLTAPQPQQAKPNNVIQRLASRVSQSSHQCHK